MHSHAFLQCCIQLFSAHTYAFRVVVIHYSYIVTIHNHSPACIIHSCVSFRCIYSMYHSNWCSIQCHKIYTAIFPSRMIHPSEWCFRWMQPTSVWITEWYRIHIECNILECAWMTTHSLHIHSCTHSRIIQYHSPVCRIHNTCLIHSPLHSWCMWSTYEPIHTKACSMVCCIHAAFQSVCIHDAFAFIHTHSHLASFIAPGGPQVRCLLCVKSNHSHSILMAYGIIAYHSASFAPMHFPRARLPPPSPRGALSPRMGLVGWLGRMAW